MSVIAVHPLNDKSINITSALEFGEVAYVNTRYVYADELDGDDLPESVYNKMLKVVDKFEPDYDYLLIAGDHLQLLTMAALLSARWGRFKVLRYDREAKGYIPVAIDSSSITS